MRTNIEIDDKLMKQAMKFSGEKTMRATVDQALRLLVKIQKQEGLRRFRGVGGWEGDLHSMRLAKGEE